MGLDRYVIAVMVFIVMVNSGILVIVDINNLYDDVNIDTSTFSDVNLTDDQIYNISQDISSNILNSDVDTDLAEGSIFSSALAGTKIVWNAFSIVGKIVSAISKAIGIPAFYVAVALTVQAIFLIFAIIFLVFRVRA